MLKTKMRIFNSSVKSVLLYSSETWRITKHTVNKIDVRKQMPPENHECEMVRQSQQQHFVDQHKSTASRNRNKMKKWRWIGHTMRKPTSSSGTTRQALTRNPKGKRKRGRPRNTWRRDVESEARKMGYTWQEIATMAQRRIRWRALIDGPCSQRVDGHK